MRKAIHLYNLLWHLQSRGLDFVLRGGVAMNLLLEDFSRVPFDLDICTLETVQTVESALDEIIKVSHFKSWKLDEIGSYKNGVPVAHYALIYDSQYHKDFQYILLDVLYDHHGYNSLTKRMGVSVPILDSLIADKLIAFAPDTIGIPL
jgi:hypothetical protein